MCLATAVLPEPIGPIRKILCLPSIWCFACRAADDIGLTRWRSRAAVGHHCQQIEAVLAPLPLELADENCAPVLVTLKYWQARSLSWLEPATGGAYTVKVGPSGGTAAATVTLT